MHPFSGENFEQIFFRNVGIHLPKYTASHTEGVTNYLALLNLVLNYHSQIPRPCNLNVNLKRCNSLQIGSIQIRACYIRSISGSSNDATDSSTNDV
jgi:hypothetical protein